MKRILVLLVLLLGYCATALSNQTGPYTSSIHKIQVIEIGDPYNTVFLDLDIVDSPCSSTNQHDRFTVANEVQLSVVLAALMAGKTIRVHGSGVCDNNIEQIANIQLFQ